MTMQLFTFGHPCEHQLHRQCIGGKSCPLCGYPDDWCCSYIKGKINFKRDKPCEGPRCRWSYHHPAQSKFEAVTEVLSEGRVVALKIDDGDDEEILDVSIDNSNVVDTVLCALKMLRNPPDNYSSRVGQLFAYAALRVRDTKVFMQLLKTVKKPVDGYILGGYDYLMRGSIPAPLNVGASSGASGGNGNSTNTNSGNNSSGGVAQGRSVGKKGGTGANGSNGSSNEKKEDIAEELKSDMVDLMNAALSSGGQLVDREDQRILQAVFIQSLRGYPKANRKRQEMLDSAMTLFGHKLGSKVGQTASAPGTAAEQPAPNNAPAAPIVTTANSIAAPAAASPTGTVTSGTTPMTTAVAATTAGPNSNNNVNVALPRTGSAGAAAGGAVVGARVAARVSENVQEDVISGVQQSVCYGGVSSSNNNSSGSNTSYANACSAGSGTTTAAAVVAAAMAAAGGPGRRNPVPAGPATPATPVTTRSKEPSVASVATSQATVVQPVRQQQLSRSSPPVVGISQLVQQTKQLTVYRYDPIRSDLPLPNITLCGGLFGLTAQSATWAPLGPVTSHKTSAQTLPGVVVGAAVAVPGATADVDEKAFRFLSPTTSGVNFFGGIDSLPHEHQLLRGICDD